MKCLCNVRCRIIKDIDMFGKEPELYYKTRPKKTSWIGRILSVVFVLVYFAFFLYKLIRMLKRVDVIFMILLLMHQTLHKSQLLTIIFMLHLLWKIQIHMILLLMKVFIFLKVILKEQK